MAGWYAFVGPPRRDRHVSPFDDVRVLDLGQFYQGPYCGMILAYLGAEVIKVQPPGGEPVRHWHDDLETPEVQLPNPNKRGITLDLTTAAGKAALKDLVAELDVLVGNYRVGTMADMRVGYDDLQAENLDLVHVHGSGFGNRGPHAEDPAVDFTIQALSGVMDSTGFPDGPPV